MDKAGTHQRALDALLVQPKPAYNLWQLIVQGARIEGFILTEYVSRFGVAIPRLTEWARAGKLRVDEHIESGIENTLPAFRRLFDGSHEGKMILKLT